MTAAQVAVTFGNDTRLATFTIYDSDTKDITMAAAITITAGQPCMIWPGAAVNDAQVDNNEWDAD